MTIRRCPRCGAVKPLEAFKQLQFIASRHDDRDVWCLACRREYNAVYWKTVRSKQP